VAKLRLAVIAARSGQRSHLNQKLMKHQHQGGMKSKISRSALVSRLSKWRAGVARWARLATSLAFIASVFIVCMK
jgi:hypothetical protein